jgi:cytochrome c556
MAYRLKARMVRLKARMVVLISLLLMLTALLVVRAAVLTLGADNRLQANLSVMNRTPQGFTALGTQVETLRRMTSDIDNYNLSEIKNALGTTARLAGYATTEFKAQYDAWITVHDKISKDKESFELLKQRLDEVQRLQDGEIVHLKALLDQSAKPSIFDNVTSAFITFAFGVVSSLAAPLIYRWGKKKRLFLIQWWRRRKLHMPAR